jgi:hypothetical protein
VFLALAAAVTTCSAEPAAVAPAVPAKGGFTLADLKAQIPQTKDGTFQIEIPQILNTATDLEVQSLLAGQSVETTGQVMPETVNNADGRFLRIFRSQLLCCSAHARQCSVGIELPDHGATFKEMAWVKLVGTLSYKREDRKIVPIIVVKEIKETAAPVNPLLN